MRLKNVEKNCSLFSCFMIWGVNQGATVQGNVGLIEKEKKI